MQTDAERSAAASQQMDESLGDFDEKIRKERERIAKERDAQAAGEHGASGEAAGSGTGRAKEAQARAGGGEGDMRQASNSPPVPVARPAAVADRARPAAA